MAIEKGKIQNKQHLALKTHKISRQVIKNGMA